MVVTFVMKRPSTPPAALSTHIALKSNSNKRQNEGAVTSYCKALSYLPDNYATHYSTADTDTDIMCFTQSSNKLATKYAEALWNNALPYDREYDKYAVKVIFTEGFLESTCNSVRAYWGSWKNATVHDMAYHATSMTKLPHGRGTPIQIITTIRRITKLEPQNPEKAMLIISIRTRHR